MAWDYKFNSINYVPGGAVEVGPAKRKTWFVDGTDAYANDRKLFISFYHVPTGKDVFFKAFITAFNETYNSDWSSETVYGRADPIYLFKQTQRQISLTFKIPASTTGEAYENLGKVQTLVQFLYPNYTDTSNATTISQSPLVRLKVMNLLQNTNDKFSAQSTKYGASATAAAEFVNSFDAMEDWAKIQTWHSHDGLLGVIDNVTVNHNLEGDDGSFVIGTSGSVLPKLLDVNLSFKPIHEHPLGWDDNGIFAGSGARTGEQRLWPYGVLLEDPEALYGERAASAVVAAESTTGDSETETRSTSQAALDNAQAAQEETLQMVTVGARELDVDLTGLENASYTATTSGIQNTDSDLNVPSATDIFDDEEPLQENKKCQDITNIEY